MYTTSKHLAMSFIQTYAVFIIPILTFTLTQFIKFVIHGIKHDWDWEYVFAYGHMPSSHTAFVVSVVTAIGYYEGVHTGVFALAVCLAVIVINDAVRLRTYMGDQSHYLNMMVTALKLDKQQFPRLKERVGHRTSEVIVGGSLGFLLTLLFIRILS